MEHHANIVPWQLHAEKVGAKIKIIPLTQTGELDLSNLDSLLTNKTKIVSIVHASNSLGTINPIKEIIRQAHNKDIPVCIDGAQSASNCKIDVQDLDCDFFAFSGNKLYSPTGIGLLYGKEKWLEAMPPYHGGGHMIKKVTFTHTSFADLPSKFEAGTASIADTIAFEEGIKYFTNLDWDILNAHKTTLLQYALEQLNTISELNIIGTAPNKIPVISFTIDGIHPHDISTILDQDGIAIRAGHHCTMPTMDFFRLPATARVSLAIYNTLEEIDKLILAILKVKKIFKK
jgi:cysteine desulfurase/selenocysteine lyase